MIGYEGIDVNGIRLHPVVIANYSKLTHHYQLIRDEARSFLIQGAVVAAKRYESYLEPGAFFVEASDAVKTACEIILNISGCTDDWSERFTPDDLVRIFLGTEEEPSVIDKLNYPVKAKQTKQALENGVPFEMQALITCMFLTENGEFDVAKEMIESLTPEQLEVLVTTKVYLQNKHEKNVSKTNTQLAEMAGVSVETATKVMGLING